ENCQAWLASRAASPKLGDQVTGSTLRERARDFLAKRHGEEWANYPYGKKNSAISTLVEFALLNTPPAAQGDAMEELRALSERKQIQVCPDCHGIYPADFACCEECEKPSHPLVRYQMVEERSR